VSHNGPFGQDQKWLRNILDSKTNGEYYFKHVQFHFSDRITYNLWVKTKVETLSAVYTKNQNSKTVNKTIIDGGHLGKIDQK
jgi:transglutaminase-like putative cysteine protease